MKSFQRLLEQRTAQYGERFSDRALSRQFVPFYESGERIKIEYYRREVTGTVSGERIKIEYYRREVTGTVGVTTGWVQRIKIEYYRQEVTGTVGVTTGWVPCFLLMRNSRAYGSSIILSDTDRILAVKVGRKYVPV